jgi:arginine-glutamic acid dipeptide repeat-containing protein
LPPHLGFSAPPFQPSMMSTSGQMPSPHNIPITKSKSPITSQPNLISHSPSQFTPVQSHVSHASKHDNNKYDLNQVSHRDIERREREHQPEDEEIEQTPLLTRGPSPEPKIEDSECHRSQSAMYVLNCFSFIQLFLN